MRDVAVIDIAGFVSDLKSHAVDHGFHVHDERHFVETYSLRQLWEVDLHPEEACSGPIDLHVSLEIDPRTLLSFEDVVLEMDDPDDDEEVETIGQPSEVSTIRYPRACVPDEKRLCVSECTAWI